MTRTFVLCLIFLIAITQESNSITLKDGVRPEESYTAKPEFKYNDNEYKFVVSVGFFTNGVINSLHGEDYEHLCFANMVTLLDALTLSFCNSKNYVWTRTTYKTHLRKFYITRYPQSHGMNGYYSIKNFLIFSDFLNNREIAVDDTYIGPAIARLERDVQFLDSLDEFPKYPTGQQNIYCELIVFNGVDALITQENIFLKWPFEKQIDPETDNGVVIKLNPESKMKTTVQDQGTAMICSGKMAGIFTNSARGYVEYVYQHDKKLNNKAKQVWSQFREPRKGPLGGILCIGGRS